MKWMFLLWITLAVVADASPASLSNLQRQVAEQERQIVQLEVENSRLRYMLTESNHYYGDPLYGTEVSGRPGGGPETEPDTEEIHIVNEGDTLSEIAAARGVELESLATLNKLSDPATIRPGQRLRLPESLPTTVENPPLQNPQHHIVASGENLYRISLRYEVELEELLAANPAVDPRKLRIGQQVLIPRPATMLAGGR